MTVTALTGPFYLMPINSLTMLALLGGLGLYAGGVGGGVEWRIPIGLIAGLLGGLVAFMLGVRIPHAGLVLSSMVLISGLLVAAVPRGPQMLMLVGAVVIGALAGLAGFIAVPVVLLDWVSLILGLMLAVAAGVGLSVIVSQAMSWQAVRGIGLAIIAYGAVLLFFTP
ncbi:hypothetical protein [Fodinicurvata sp. EGI_FJ10296]|uniref:hypothetical protein n=1 Tax=Fodinicurvata sp. EGI_FJ10296 TaxID=3231908 RepID=UPI0034518DC2